MDTEDGRLDHDPRLQLVPAPGSARAWMFVLAVVLPMAMIVVVLGFALPTDALGRVLAGRSTLAGTALAIGATLIVLAVWWLLDRLLRRHRLSLHGGRLVVRSGFNTCSLALADLHLDAARVVDLDERTEYRPMLKLNGTGLPRFQSGWYLLRDRSRAFVAITGGRRVLWIPTHKKHALLLQPGQPQLLLDALREMAAAATRR